MFGVLYYTKYAFKLNDAMDGIYSSGMCLRSDKQLDFRLLY